MEKEQIKEKLQQLKEIISKSNPEILELKFGCEVEVENGKRFFITEMPEIYFRQDGDLMEILEYPTSPDAEANIYTITKILGRPISLADVCLAYLRKRENELWDWEKKKVRRETYFEDIVGKWDLEDDNLVNQDSETINFLWELLCK